MKFEIKSKKHYHEVMIQIYELMNKGECALSEEEVQKLAVMSEAAECYEDEVLKLMPVKQPDSIAEYISLRMFEKKLNQARLAELLGIAKSKLSEILSGKRKPDVPFLKAVHKVLQIDAEFLLDHA
jgi:antitoxin component HigA of HigAB toxin-antitoxin module